MNDFRIVVYCPSNLLLHGGNPYDRAQFLALCPVDEGLPLYLPSSFLLHAPFGLLPADVATVAYFALTVLLTIVLALVAYRWSDVPVRPAQVAGLAGVLLLSRPGQWNILLGQPTLEFVLATLGAIYFAARSPVLAGACLAVALCKPTFGAPLLLLMLARGDTRAVVMGCGLALAANLPLLFVLGWRAGGLENLLAGIVAGQREWEATIDPTAKGAAVDVSALLGRFTGAPLSMGWQVLVALLVVGSAAYAIHRIGARPEPAERRLIQSLMCIAILASVHHHAYDLLLLTPPVLTLAVGALPPGLFDPRARVALLALFGLLALNYAAANAVLSHLRDAPMIWLAVASSNGAALLLAFMAYVGATLANSSYLDRPRSWARRFGDAGF